MGLKGFWIGCLSKMDVNKKKMKRKRSRRRAFSALLEYPYGRYGREKREMRERRQIDGSI